MQDAELTSASPATATAAVDFGRDIGRMRPELHCSGFGPQSAGGSREWDIEGIKSMGFKASRTHDWGLINPGQRVCDYYNIFPLMHLDAADPANYVFGPTDHLLELTRGKLGHDILFRLGPSIEHTGPKVHFNALIPDDFDKVAEVFAGIVRHYNRGWAGGHEWGIKYWEIWNEPDISNDMWCLPDGNFGVGGTEEARAADRQVRDRRRRDLFVKFFVTVLKRLKGEFPEIRVGGPGMNWMAEDYFSEIFAACGEAGVAPDFISWHHYHFNPDVIMKCIDDARRLCDRFGFRDCELFIDEWHYQGDPLLPLNSPDPAVRRRLLRPGPEPESFVGVESSCYTLAMLMKFQTSKLDQAYFYGCMNTGPWGYRNDLNEKNKVYYALKIFGDFIRKFPVICDSSASDGITVLAARSEDGMRKGVLVCDFRSGADAILLDAHGLEPSCDVRAWVHDNGRDFERYPVRMFGNRILLKKADSGCAAFFIESGLLWL